ncbi:ATP phosphoribosyltransferase [Methanocorpusculaceae archaeon Sp1]|nr:ATP phosphoribosyltransferase [Methanocorpusculaceae archaeon Sp1]
MMSTSSKIRLAIPNKGRIAEPINDLMNRSGIHIQMSASRQLIAKTVDPQIEVLFVRPIDIPEYVAKGVADIGITGIDMVAERGSDVSIMLDLKFGSARLVLAVPEKSPVQSVKDLSGLRIATEFPGICRRYFADAGVDVTLIEVSGACEAAPQLGVADAIVDLTSSGTTLEINKLRIVDEIISSTTNVIANHESLKEKHEKIEEILLAFESVIAAKGQCYLMLNVDKSKLDDVRRLIPGLGGPTIMDIAGSGAVAVHAVVPHVCVYQLINLLKRAGARDILVLDITRMVR